MLTADRGIPVCLAVMFLNLKEKHSNVYNYLAKFIIVTLSDRLWLLLQSRLKASTPEGQAQEPR